MTSSGNINASAIAARNDATVALANFNFELSLFTHKIAPPREFEEIGRHLSASRLKEAQDGTRHSIARKLGILFKSVIPSTPELIKAYGTRASEIARSNTANPRGDDKSHGVFASNIGADGTTLWAAATSGRPAIACHLLACMLARMWDPPEATSIWVEIVSARKDEVERKLLDEGEVEQELLTAAAQTFQRSDLADWDASARAWLRVADSAMASRQIQLRLIIDNLRLPVNTKHNTYENIIQAWTSAMVQMEKLLEGVPLLRLQSGDICLGLSSWHLYPNMVHLSSESKTIEQNDPLFRGGGIVTLGLEPLEAGDYEAHRSVYWSLPLAHLRYYGLPVSRCRNISTAERDRLTMDEFLWVMTSAYMRSWDGGTAPKTSVIQYFGDVSTSLDQAILQAHNTFRSAGLQVSEQQAPSSANCPSVTSWLSLLAKTSRHYLSRLNEERVQRLRNLGLEYCKTFAGEPFQHIFNASNFLKAAYDLEDKIKLLREVAETLRDTSQDRDYEYIIAYKCKLSGLTADFITVEYATAFPEPEIPEEGEFRGQKSHRRWLAKGSTDDGQDFEEQRNDFDGRVVDQNKEHPNDATAAAMERKQSLREARIEVIHQRAGELRSKGENVAVVPSSNTSFPVFERRLGRRAAKNGETIDESRKHPVILIERKGRQSTSRHKQSITPKEEPRITIKLSPTSIISYELIYGDVHDIALFRRQRDRAQRPYALIHQPGSPTVDRQRPHTYTMPIEKIMEYFTARKVNFEKLAKKLDRSADLNANLLGLCLAANLYNDLDGATVDVRTAQFDFSKAHWVTSAIHAARRAKRESSGREGSNIILQSGRQEANLGAHRSFQGSPASLLSIHPRDIDHATCFACITMFETGTFNLHPDQLSNVFAFPSADSLYVASALLRDPASNPKQTAIQRCTGNIGRAGVAFLVPPVEPLIREYGIGEWYEYNRTDFDGTLDDYFSGTSLHLSFSEASMQVDVGYSGGRDIEAYLLETLVSVYDQQRNIGELDILATFASNRLITEFLTAEECNHSFNSPDVSAIGKQKTEHPTKVGFISIDNFAEIIKPPSQPGIIRARGNWQARLAAASICIAKGYRVILRPERICLNCLTKMYIEGESQTIESAIKSESGVVMIL